MLGDPGEDPFVGHLRFSCADTNAWVSVAGRVAADSGAIAAFVPARRLEVTLRTALIPLLSQDDRYLLLHRVWDTLDAMAPVSLGSAGGAALSLVVVAGDTTGVGVSGTGLSMVWGRFGGRWRPLVRPDHPMLGASGRPEESPGVLGLSFAPEIFLATPNHLPPRLPESGVLHCAGSRL